MFYKSTAFNSSAKHLHKSVIIPFECSNFNTVPFVLTDGNVLRVRVELDEPLAMISCYKAICLVPNKYRIPDQFGQTLPFSYVGQALMFTGESQKNFAKAFFNEPDSWLQAPSANGTVLSDALTEGKSILASADLGLTDQQFPSAYYMMREGVPFPKDGVVWHFAKLGNVLLQDLHLEILEKIKIQLSGSHVELISLSNLKLGLDSGRYELLKSNCWNKGGKTKEPSLKRQYRTLVETGLMDINYFK